MTETESLPAEPKKDRWEVHFIKVNKAGLVIREKTFSCTVEDYGVVSAAEKAVHLMIDSVSPVEDAGYMRVSRMINLNLVEKE